MTDGGEPSFTILYSRCVHLGCPVQPNGPIDEKARKNVKGVELRPVLAQSFGCPCHGGLYDAEGNRRAGPPVRSMDRYTFSIKNGHLVLGELYAVGQRLGYRGERADLALSVVDSGHARRRRRGVALSDRPEPGDGLGAWLRSPSGSRSSTWPSSRRSTGSTSAPRAVRGTKWFLFRNVPRDVSWVQTLGSAALTAFIVQALTGAILAMYYEPSASINPVTGKPVAYSSIQAITSDLTLGWLVRGMHRWGASVFIILLFLHMGRVFLFGAYKYPRELNVDHGVLILATGMLMGFTGYLLPWDQTAYWASAVGINLNGTAPFAGPWLAQFLAGGPEIGTDTLPKFYAMHMLLIPGRAHRAHRRPHLPRHPARRRVAAVVERGGRP